MNNAYATDSHALDRAISLARGSYQRDLLFGGESLSGASLRGKARRYSGRYAASRASLLGRLTAAGVHWREVRGTHGKRVLVVGPLAPFGASDVGARCV